MSSGERAVLERRVPQLARGELRVAVLLDAAETVFEEAGYDAATMTAIAQKAGSSIGALYQYYGDKAAVAAALCQRFGEELLHELRSFAERAPTMNLQTMVKQLVEIVIGFSEKHPTLLPLMHVPGRQYSKSDYRRSLRLLLAQIFQLKAKTLSDGEAYRMASLTVQALRILHPLAVEAESGERQPLRQEVAEMLNTYLVHKLRKRNRELAPR